MCSECIRTESAGGHVVDNGARVAILVELQIGVDQIVLTVHLISRRLVCLSRLHGGNVGRNRIFPESDSGKDVRGHMLRMRCSRRDLRVAPGGVDPFLRERRRVIEVDEIMSDTWMSGLALVDSLQDGGALELIGVS